MEFDSPQHHFARMRPDNPRGNFTVATGDTLWAGHYVDIPMAVEDLAALALGQSEVLSKYVQPVEGLVGSYALVGCEARLINASYSRPVVGFDTFTECTPAGSVAYVGISQGRRRGIGGLFPPNRYRRSS